jgi:hypothetical protein
VSELRESSAAEQRLGQVEEKRLTHPEQAMHADHDAAKDEAQDYETEKVIAIKLKENRIHGSGSNQQSACFGQELVDL